MEGAKSEQRWKSFDKSEVGDSLLFFGSERKIRNSNVGIQIRRFLLPMLAILDSLPLVNVFPCVPEKQREAPRFKLYNLFGLEGCSNLMLPGREGGGLMKD